MTIRNRELSQFSSFLFIDDSSQNIGIATEATPNVGIGTANATHKFTVVGNSSFGGNISVTGISTFNGNVTLGLTTNNTISFISRVNSGILPSTDGTLNLGGPSNKWGSIYANTYENFKLVDLPTTSEPTFAAERVLKVKSDGSGYELANISELLSVYSQRQFSLSNDGEVYTGIGSTVSNRLQISGISTNNFFIGERVKVFGITAFSDNTLVPNPVVASSIASKVGSSPTVSTYRYWIAQYNLRNGKVGIASQISPTQGIEMDSVGNFNEQNHITLTLARTDSNHGILVYRQIGVSTNINEAKLIGILGPKELSFSTSDIGWKDFGTFDQTEWSLRGNVNEYNNNQIHFPNIASTNHQRGWNIDSIVSIGQSSITLNNQYRTNADIGTTSAVKVVHDNTFAFKEIIESAINSKIYSVELQSGTYLTNKIDIPSGFTLKGNGKNTVIKQQYFATDVTDGAGNFLQLNGNVIGISTINASNVTIKDLTIDGNLSNNILFYFDDDNYIAYFLNLSSSLIKNIEIRNSAGSGMQVQNSSRLSIENCSFIDGSFTDRYPFSPLDAQESESLRINDCLFENYSGPVDLSVTSVVVTGGNIIRNCGTGLRTFASGKITTTNNIILGPSDEWIPSPDIYDSDYNSINLTIQRGNTFTGPVLQYLEDGVPKDLSTSKVSITSGIGTIVGQGTTNETLGNRFINFNIPTSNDGAFGRQNGYIQLTLDSTQTSTLGLSSALGYDIIATEYLNIPVGFTTAVGIASGVWNIIGVGATQYTITLADYTQFSGISTGDVVKLVNHSVSPDLSSYQLTVESKIDESSLIKKLRLVGFTTTSITNGSESGYISIRNIFTIAKGRVGVI